MTASGHPGSCLTHRTYHLTCDDFRALVDDQQAMCAICGVSGPETDHGVLCIDHDGYRGRWAVRGLLCSPCNTRIDACGYTRTAEEDAYVANPWFERRFALLELRTVPLPEPPIGAVVKARKRYWRHTEEGWRQVGRPQAVSWSRLNRLVGPHAIQIPDARDIRHEKGEPRRRPRASAS